MLTSFVSGLVMLGAFAEAYPVTYTNCGLNHVVDKTPERVITMTQGATEFLLALGLHSRMVGTAYLDDKIWPKYAAEYAKIPVLSSEYPNETTIMSKAPDFIVANFNSAFRQRYEDDGKMKGIFSDASGIKQPCTGTGGEELGMTETPSNKLTCRKELQEIDIGTFLFQDACEDESLRPKVVSEQIVYEEMRALGKIFNVDAEKLITDMGEEFKDARRLVSAGMHNKPLKAVWLDCVGRCCETGPGEEPQVFVGANGGAPAMLMKEAGLTNTFADVKGNWACVKETDVIAAAPDVFIVVDAAWDTAISKLTWLYNHSEFCKMDSIKAARLVQIPFSATSMGPRNGPAAHDLAVAALHVRNGDVTSSHKSGVGSFSPAYLASELKNLACTVDMNSVVYDGDVVDACCHRSVFLWLLVVACMYDAYIYQH